MSYRHQRAWDLRGIADPAHHRIVVDALRACDFPFSRITRRTGKRVPVSVSDLSRFAAALSASHAHVEGPDGEGGHLLGDPHRRAALGLYWLPTTEHPAGRVELDTKVMSDPTLAAEVFLAEAAHAVDYGCMTASQRESIGALFEHVHAGHDHAGWFEEAGEEGGYWAFRGERWMGAFAAAYASSLPRPLESRQPWHWTYDATDVEAVRRILRSP